ncbi:alpha/beta-hydrolase [Rhizodiscina lignyota]|uniref:Alpha/beta-hydrolase n=1 Tax=Rhizodiscina lignyota TaxID=1504668 RepID=A0A9P4IF75_9PEZI|nr:alpha/beta-hydrolase [Rhizodiscina lignyota]
MPTPPRVSFFTKGERLPHSTSYIIVNQNYVQYVPPRSNASTDATPLLFIHGGGLTGANWESTPDRRPGWAVRASESGRHVYIMDGVDSGRSQRAPDEIRPGPVEHRGALEMWDRFRFGRAEDFEARKVFPDSVFLASHLDELVACQAARRRIVDDIETSGIINVIKELAVGGKIDVVCHSHGAKMLTDPHCMKEVGPYVRKAILVEPGTTATSENGKSFVEGMKCLVVWGDYVADHPAWVPIVKIFDQAPVPAVEIMHLPEVGLKGNSHFPMSDANSDEVWQKLLDWLDAKSRPSL